MPFLMPCSRVIVGDAVAVAVLCRVVSCRPARPVPPAPHPLQVLCLTFCKMTKATLKTILNDEESLQVGRVGGTGAVRLDTGAGVAVCWSQQQQQQHNRQLHSMMVVNGGKVFGW